MVRPRSRPSSKRCLCGAPKTRSTPWQKLSRIRSPTSASTSAKTRVRERLVNQRTGIINQIRAFLLERGIAVRQGQRFLRAELPRILSTPPEVLSPRMVRMIEGLTGDWRRLDERIDGLFGEIGRIQMRKTDPLHLLTFGLHRTAG